tara:strand:+ start:300 stop:623 length:324 start_codon:yes stop_codon:yes gene_type:complete
MTTTKIYVNHEATDTNGTCLQGTLWATKRELKSVFGKPLFESFYADDKVLTEWVIEFEDGSVATIYDWKLDEPLGMDDNYEWHIGGHHNINGRVKEVLANAQEYEIV